MLLTRMLNRYSVLVLIGGLIAETTGDCMVVPDAAGHVNFPSTLNSIPQAAFHSCSQLRSISIPPSVRSIAFDAFYNTQNFHSVVIPSTVSNIASLAFHGAALTSAIIASNVRLSGNSFQRALCNLNNGVTRGNGIFVAGARICNCGTCAPTTAQPTPPPTRSPTSSPSTSYPTQSPSIQPTFSPTARPSVSPSSSPSTGPTLSPSRLPTTSSPSNIPTYSPSSTPTYSPTISPTITPTSVPTDLPTSVPTDSPTEPFVPMAASSDDDDSGSSMAIIVGIVACILVGIPFVVYVGVRRWQKGGKAPAQIPTFDGQGAIYGVPTTPEIVAGPVFTNHAFLIHTQNDYALPTKSSSFKDNKSVANEMVFKTNETSDMVYAIPVAHNGSDDEFGNFYEEPKTPSTPGSLFGFEATDYTALDSSQNVYEAKVQIGNNYTVPKLHERQTDYAALDSSQNVYGAKQIGNDYAVPNLHEQQLYESPPIKLPQDSNIKPLYHFASGSSVATYDEYEVPIDIESAINPLSSEENA